MSYQYSLFIQELLASTPNTLISKSGAELENILCSEFEHNRVCKDLFCPQCNCNKTFVLSDFNKSNVNEMHASYWQNHLKSIPSSNVIPVSMTEKQKYQSIHGLAIFRLICPTCGFEEYFPIVYKETQFIRLQEYPSQIRYKNFELKRFNILSKDFSYFLELSSANYLASTNNWIGAYTYVRRCLEFFINSKLKTEDIRKEFKCKVDILANELDSSLLESLKDCYGILSMGIHELSEDICRQYFKALYSILILLLDDELGKIKKKNELGQLKKEVARGASELNSK